MVSGSQLSDTDKNKSSLCINSRNPGFYRVISAYYLVGTFETNFPHMTTTSQSIYQYNKNAMAANGLTGIIHGLPWTYYWGMI